MTSQHELSVLYWISHVKSIDVNYETYCINVHNGYYKFIMEPNNKVALFIDDCVPFISIPVPIRDYDKSFCNTICLFGKCKLPAKIGVSSLPCVCSYQHGNVVICRSKSQRCIVCGFRKVYPLKTYTLFNTTFHLCHEKLCVNIFTRKIAGTFTEEKIILNSISVNCNRRPFIRSRYKKSAFKKFL